MKPRTPGSDRYHRSVTKRFEPCETVKEIIGDLRADIVDATARIEIEHRVWEPLFPAVTDENGYPVS